MRASSPPDRPSARPAAAEPGCTRHETRTLQLGYLVGAGLLLAHVGAVLGWLPPLRGHTWQVALLAAGYLGVLTRHAMRGPAPSAHCYLSHLRRLLGTLGVFAAVELLSTAAPLAAAFLVAIFPPIAFLLLFPWIVAWPLAAWMAWRLWSGYHALRRREAVGSDPGPGGVRNWGIYRQEAIIPVMGLSPPSPPRPERRTPPHGLTPS